MEDFANGRLWMMRPHLKLVAVLALSGIVLAACGASEPEEPPAIREAPPEEPEGVGYDITDTAITEQEPAFTSANVMVFGARLGDVTADVVENFGPQSGETQSEPQDWVQSYHDGGLTVHTLKVTGEARQFVITTTLADQIADPNLKAWLENGDAEALREWMGPEEQIVEDRVSNNAVEYVYGDRGLIFINYHIDGQSYNAIRVTEL
jgi:hypothetical protein